MLFWRLKYNFNRKECIFRINVCFMIFMHYVILITCGCTNSMLLSISIFVGRWGAGRKTWTLASFNRSWSMSSFDSRAYMSFMLYIRSILIAKYFYISIVNGSCPKYSCVICLMKLRISISYDFIWKRFFKSMICFVKSFNFALVFTMFML